jgi:hypothetical protein
MHPNYVYQVTQIEGDLITLFEPFEKINFIVKAHTVMNHFKFQFSETAHSIQGETFNEKITIYDVNTQNWCMNARWAYVALTRSSNIFENVTICCDVIHNNNIMNLGEKIKAYEITDKQKGFVFDEIKYPRLNEERFRKLYRQQQGCCSICESKVKLNYNFSQDLKQYSMDRIDNDFEGGHCMENLRITCLHCNVSNAKK